MITAPQRGADRGCVDGEVNTITNRISLSNGKQYQFSVRSTVNSVTLTTDGWKIRIFRGPKENILTERYHPVGCAVYWIYHLED